MVPYKNNNGNSGVQAYEIGPDYITVKFTNTIRTYTYSYSKAGKEYVETMKQLAENGAGLNSFINRYVQKLYD